MISSTLKKQIAWITGSGRGIGKSIAQELAVNGVKVVVSSRTKAEIESVAQQINENGGSALAIQCDVTQKQQVKELVDQVKQQWGDIDILVNNAGIVYFAKIIDYDEQKWDELMNTNLKSAFLCSQAVLPGMIKKQSGHIINVVSVAGKQAFPNNAGYCASKYGMLGFTDVLRMEARKHNVKVTAFLPGATDTEIWGNANVDRSKMLTPKQAAECVLAICGSHPDALPEEVVLRPIGGDL